MLILYIHDLIGMEVCDAVYEELSDDTIDLINDYYRDYIVIDNTVLIKNVVWVYDTDDGSIEYLKSFKDLIKAIDLGISFANVHSMVKINSYIIALALQSDSSWLLGCTEFHTKDDFCSIFIKDNILVLYTTDGKCYFTDISKDFFSLHYIYGFVLNSTREDDGSRGFQLIIQSYNDIVVTNEDWNTYGIGSFTLDNPINDVVLGIDYVLRNCWSQIKRQIAMH